ncbi:MAG: type II toxin-antitoxin system ParD family antitoxin [Pyrinomonadaceae bacterium]
MNVNLTPELDQLVNDKVKSGLYNSASEVVREALRLMQEKDEYRRIRLSDLRREIDIGIEQSRRGESSPVDFEAIKVQGRRRRATKAAK